MVSGCYLYKDIYGRHRRLESEPRTHQNLLILNHPLDLSVNFVVSDLCYIIKIINYAKLCTILFVTCGGLSDYGSKPILSSIEIETTTHTIL